MLTEHHLLLSLVSLYCYNHSAPEHKLDKAYLKITHDFSKKKLFQNTIQTKKLSCFLVEVNVVRTKLSSAKLIGFTCNGGQ